VRTEKWSRSAICRLVFPCLASSAIPALVGSAALNQTPASVSQKVNAFDGRITNLERQAGTYNFIQVQKSGAENKLDFALSGSAVPGQRRWV